jgi:hypothetical protein
MQMRYSAAEDHDHPAEAAMPRPIFADPKTEGRPRKQPRAGSSAGQGVNVTCSARSPRIARLGSLSIDVVASASPGRRWTSVVSAIPVSSRAIGALTQKVVTAM